MLTLCRWIARLRARRLRRDIDEDTHLNHRPKPTTMVVFPQKRAPIKVFVQSFDQTARTSPSTFLFLLSSHCQRADPKSLSKGGVIGDLSLHILKGTASCLRLPGSNPALSEDHRQWERPALGVVSAAGSSRGRRACQHPFFRRTAESFIRNFPAVPAANLEFYLPDQPLASPEPRSRSPASAMSGL